MNSIFLSAVILFVTILIFILRKLKSSKLNGSAGIIKSDFRFSVYQSPKVNGSKSLTLVLEGNRIDELGYQIYKSHTADLDKIDILIRDNGTGEVMKIVKEGDSESMIGVSHPDMGHIGYLKFDIVQIN